MTFNVTSLQEFFNSQKFSKYVVAFSGGIDSTVLLHVMRVLNLPLHAVHINHHMQVDSDQWALHCESICQAWKIPCTVLHVYVEKKAQQSIEETARTARYNLFSEYINQQSCLVTAHHKNDLVETLLLQLLRGSGPAGLAAMSKVQKFYSGKHLRPMLTFARDEIEDYAQQRNLVWIEDPSNLSNEFDRNYLRNEIIPKLLDRWPGALQTLSRAVDLQRDALDCLYDLAELDLQTAKTSNPSILQIPVLQKMKHVRLRNVLRRWMQQHDMRAPNKKQLEKIILDIVCKPSSESSPVQTWLDGEIRRYREQLYLMQPLLQHDVNQVYEWELAEPLYIESLHRTLTIEDLIKHAVLLPKNAKSVLVRFRTGGESIKPFGKKHHRSLKNLFQEANVPPWERERIPLIYYGEELISVLGYWNAQPACDTSKLL